MEMLKALSAVSIDNSLLRVPPWRNGYLLAGVALPFSLHLAILYVPIFNKIFNVYPLTVDDWKRVLMFAGPVLIVEEVLKAIGRMVNKKKVEKQREQMKR